ncbi:MAG TPA: arsenic resistance N-acetyltransferase ArsN2 [Chitinophagaceae bacterium]
MDIRQIVPEQRSDFITLLQANQLPYEDLPADLQHFLVAIEQNNVIAAIGLEQYGTCGLLRSMVVHQAYRDRQVAASLVEALETRAKKAGIGEIYLLTETAEAYFARKGYQRVTRADVPQPLYASSEFSHVCPQSAVVMRKQLKEEAATL